MSPESERIEALFKLYIDGSITKLQRIELEGCLQHYPELQALYREWNDGDAFLTREWADFVAFDPPIVTEEVPNVKRTYFSPIRLVACVAMFIVAFAAVWFYRSTIPKTEELLTRNQRYKNDVIAGSNKAIATFADGRLLFLSDTVTNHGQKVSNVAFSAGQIKYSSANNDESGFNTVSTPQGGQYHVILPDGTSARLNATSSIRFPVAFDKRKRMVEIQGEVYFDVVSDKARPFIVNLPNNAQIEVLGTSFNVKAYPNDPAIKTTVDEGSVKFKAGEDALLMKSGEQIQLTTQVSNPVLLKRKVVSNTETTWKDGYFNFENADLKTIMTEVARWYDVDVEYKTETTEQFSILMLPRNLSISRVLELLEMTEHVKFIIDGRRITVMT